MLKKILLGLVIVIVIFCIIVAMQPSDFAVVRSAKMKSPTSAPFALVNDFKKWPQWSPWEKVDPAMTKTYSTPSEGKGATYAWKGNSEVGSGDMTITESQPSELIKINLHFLEPMEGTCPTEFTFKPEGDETLVTWKMTGKHNFIAKAMCLFMSMDKMIGGQFEKGLADMKKNVEGGAETSAAPAETKPAPEAK